MIRNLGLQTKAGWGRYIQQPKIFRAVAVKRRNLGKRSRFPANCIGSPYTRIHSVLDLPAVIANSHPLIEQLK
jgi:hypothetical protein